MHLIERTIRAFTKPPAALERASLQPGHPIVPNLAWALPVVLQVSSSLYHGMKTMNVIDGAIIHQRGREETDP